MSISDFTNLQYNQLMTAIQHRINDLQGTLWKYEIFPADKRENRATVENMQIKSKAMKEVKEKIESLYNAGGKMTATKRHTKEQVRKIQEKRREMLEEAKGEDDE